jgi:hypothetical protein
MKKYEHHTMTQRFPVEARLPVRGTKLTTQPSVMLLDVHFPVRGSHCRVPHYCRLCVLMVLLNHHNPYHDHPHQDPPLLSGHQCQEVHTGHHCLHHQEPSTFSGPMPEFMPVAEFMPVQEFMAIMHVNGRVYG